MLKLELKPIDLHTKKAAEIFKVKPEDVTTQQRDYAKRLLYVRLYSTSNPFNQETK